MKLLILYQTFKKQPPFSFHSLALFVAVVTNIYQSKEDMRIGN